MSTAHPAVVPDLSTRRAPAYGAFNLTALQLEVRRLLRGGAVQRDGETRPIKYRAVSAALRELLLSRQ